MLFQKTNYTARTVLPIAFFGLLVTLLVVSENLGGTQASTMTVKDGKVMTEEGETPVESTNCKTNSDCPLPTTYCGENGKCTELAQPICNCSQPQVLRCYDENEKARFLYCPNGCIDIQGGAICQ